MEVKKEQKRRSGRIERREEEGTEVYGKQKEDRLRFKGREERME